MQLYKYSLLGIMSVLLLAGCATTTINSQSRSGVFATHDWGILPFANHTSVPQAADRVSAITKSLLLARGVRHIYSYPQSNRCNNLINCTNQMPPQKEIRIWAKRYGISYLISGSVNEWRYKVGLDGEPAANVTLTITSVNGNHVLWSSVGSKTGGSRSGLSNTGQRLIANMLASVRIRY